MLMRRVVGAFALTAMLGACAGRDPVAPVPVAQPQDTNQTCQALHAEMTVNNTRIASLQSEESNKRGQNIAMGVVGGILFWPALLAMDFKDAAGTDRKNIEARQSYLLTLYAQKNCVAPQPVAGKDAKSEEPVEETK